MAADSKNTTDTTGRAVQDAFLRIEVKDPINMYVWFFNCFIAPDSGNLRFQKQGSYYQEGRDRNFTIQVTAAGWWFPCQQPSPKHNAGDYLAKKLLERPFFATAKMGKEM